LCVFSSTKCTFLQSFAKIYLKAFVLCPLFLSVSNSIGGVINMGLKAHLIVDLSSESDNIQTEVFPLDIRLLIMLYSPKLTSYLFRYDSRYYNN
jgi:hypothetical protein